MTVNRGQEHTPGGGSGPDAERTAEPTVDGAAAHTAVLNYDPVDGLAEGIARALGKARRSGNEWMACCPVHDDQTPSLSLADRPGGGVLVHCQAGCKQADVIDALRARGLWPEREQSKDSLAYPYHDECGNHLFTVHRLDRPGGKRIWQTLADGTRKAYPQPRPLFRLPEVANRTDAPVLVVEGEKATLAAADRFPDFVVTTSAGGSKAARTADWSPLKGREVTIWPDADKAGHRYADEVAGCCRKAGAATVRIVALPPELPDGWDLADPVPDGIDLMALLESSEKELYGLGLVSLGDVLSLPDEAVSWLVEDTLPAGGLGALTAKPKAGKSTLARCLALCVARGQPWIGKVVAQGSVIYLALEEKRGEVKKHFQSMGATLSEPVHLCFNQAPADAFARLEHDVERVRPSLVIIDPLFRFTRVADANDYAQMTTALEPLLRLSRDSGVCVLFTHHSNKGRGWDGDETLGSTAIFGAVDTLLSIRRTDRYRTIYSRQRYGKDLEETVIRLDDAGAWVEVGGSRTEVDKRETGEAILQYLRTQDEPVGEPDITDNVEARTTLIRSALRSLVAAGKVKRQGSGRKADPFLYCLSSCPQHPQGTRKQESGGEVGNASAQPGELTTAEKYRRASRGE